ncbi:enoyl-CoA hydratase/isomerase family protein [Parasphingorhabdus sp.]
MMMFETLLVEKADQVLSITLNRPEKLNALSPTLLDELKSALETAKVDEAVSVVIIRSAGHVFSAGYDLSEKDWIISQFPADFEHGVDLQQDREDIAGLLDYWLEMWKFPKPIITQVQGPCLSGAGELLAVSDLVVASPEASFGHPAARDLGIPPTMFLWPLLIGMRKTKELLYTAKSISAAEAQSLGLINDVVPADQLTDTVNTLALDIARTPINHLSLLKESTNNWYENMGLHTSAAQAADLDAVFHQSPTFKAFFDIVRKDGMKAALKARKKRFG